MENSDVETVDAIVVGAGLGGLRALHTLREAGFSTTVLEARDDLGVIGRGMLTPVSG